MTKFNGINHIALATRDIETTVRFWRDLLGMRLLATVGRPGYRQYFFQVSENDMIAFFEWPDVKPIPDKDHGVPVKGPFAFDHLSIGVESMDDLWELKAKLDAAGFWASEIVDHGFIFSLYSFDPNNIPIEFSVWDESFGLKSNPIIADTDPAPAALEGPDPNAKVWPEVSRQTDEKDRKIYPGMGSELRKIRK
jgi:catechol 2,3-dioxygenase-like lactoylglutathione lyase family enzyme